MGGHIELGLRKNAAQFTLLVLINAFVGGMVGMERSIFSEYAQQGFDLSAQSAILTFIAAFGSSKALANYFSGRWANRWGRKNILLLGWVLALPVPLMLIYAPSWSWVITANVFLGLSQGLAWSSTVVMKIDLVGEKNRGLAMGLNEFKAGVQKKLYLGNLDAVRDWGYTPEYVEGMWRMLQHDKPMDYVLATGHAATIKDFLGYTFEHIGLNWEEFVEFDQHYLRPTEVDALIGDA